MGSLYTSSSSHDWCLLAGGRLLVPALIVLSFLHSVQTVDINAASFQLPPPPFLTGNLATNNILTEAERLHNGVVSTPGSFVVVGADAIFTVTRDGQVVNIAPCRPVVIASLSSRGCRTPRECGYLISIRLNADKLILVLDAYRGLFEVNPRTGAFRHIYDSGTVVNGRASVYLNDMVLMPDGTIIMTDSSPTFDYANEFWIRFEGRPDGRLLGFNPTSGQVKEILAGLAYPTGLEITSDGQALLVAEAGRARVVRLELSKDKFFHKSIFNVNLPGMPEHIRKTKHGTYWVGLTYPRYQGDVSIMDQYSNSAISRNFLAKRRPMDQLMLMYTRRGLAVELDGNGIVVSSIHDSDGLRVKDVCEVVEADGILYVGTRDQHAVLRVMKYAVDLTMTSALQILRSRCQVMDEQINVAKAALEQQVLAQKGSQAEGSVLSTILTGNNFNIVLQNYLHQQQLAHAASSQASRPTPPRPPAAPRSRLDTIRQGLAQLQHSLLRPSNNRVAQITNNRQRPGQSQAPPPNDDPFIPLGMSPGNFVTPPRNIPQSDTSAPGRNVIPNQHSPSSPLVVHRMENGQLVTHVLLDNDFKVHDHTAQTTTTLRPTAAASRLMNYTPTPPTLMRTAGPDMPSPQGGRHPLTSSSQTNSGASGGFFDFLNGMPAQAKGKENFPFDESTPAVPLPDSGPVIPAENPYYLGLSHSEAHNNTPSEHGGAGYAQNSSSSFGKGPIHFEPAFQPSDKAESLHMGGHITQPPAPQNSAKTAMLRQGFQMLQQYFKQTRQTQPSSHVTEPTVILDGANTGHGNYSNSQNLGDAYFRNNLASDQSINQTLPKAGVNQEVYSTVSSLEKPREFTAINDMLKRDQQLSYSRAAAIHPNQPINDVSPRELSPMVNEFPSTMPATSVQRARARQPAVEIASEGEGGSSNGYIKIVQGPGKYILIPLTHTTLLQALRGVGSVETLNSLVGDQALPREGPAGRTASQTQRTAKMPEQLDWPRNESVAQSQGQTEQPNWPRESSPRRHWSSHTVTDFSRQQPGDSDAARPQQMTQNRIADGSARPGVSELQQHSGPRDSAFTSFDQHPFHSDVYMREGNRDSPQDSMHGRSSSQQNWRESTRTTPSRMADNRHVGRAPNHPSEFTDAPPNYYHTPPAPQNHWPSEGSHGPTRSSGNNHGESRDRWATHNDPSNNRPSDNQPNQSRQSPRSRYDNDQFSQYRPNNNQPNDNQPNSNQPNNNQPNDNQPNSNQPNDNEPNNNQPNNNQPNSNQPNNNQPYNNQPPESWSDSNNRHTDNQPSQSWAANNQPGESWSNANQPTRSWSANNPPTQSWSRESPPTQSWRTNNPPTPPWSNDNHQTRSWATNNPPTPPWSNGNHQTRSWATNNPPTQSWAMNNPPTHSWPTNNPPTRSWSDSNTNSQSWPGDSNPGQSWSANDNPPQPWSRDGINASASSQPPHSWQTGNTTPQRNWSPQPYTPGNAYTEDYVTATRGPSSTMAQQQPWSAHVNPSQPSSITDFPSAPANQAPPTAHPQQTWSSGSRQDVNSTLSTDHMSPSLGQNDSYSLNDRNSQHFQDQAYETQWQVPAA